MIVFFWCIDDIGNAFDISRIQNTDIPWAGRVVAHGGAMKQGPAGLHANRFVRSGTRDPFNFRGMEKHVLLKSLLCTPDVGIESAVDDRFICGLSPGRQALFCPGC